MRAVEWVAGSLKDLGKFPEPVREVFAYAIYLAQTGSKHPDAKPLKGRAFPGASVLEIVEDHHGDTYRAVYTVKFEKAVYVLHCFQKKSRTGIKTPKEEIELIVRRLKSAADHYKRAYED